jgi:hypothetical protein
MEAAEGRTIMNLVDQAIDGNHQIEQLRQELQNLNNTLDSVRLCLEAIEQNTRYGNREWRVMEVLTSDLIPRCEELFNRQWHLDRVLATSSRTQQYLEGDPQTGIRNYPARLILIFWRPLFQTKPTEPEGDKPNV